MLKSERDQEIQRVWAQREAKIEADKIRRGFSLDRHRQFLADEEERSKLGEVPSLDELNLPEREYQTFRRFGVKTVAGVEEIIERGWRPYGFGEKSRATVSSLLEKYNPQSN